MKVHFADSYLLTPRHPVTVNLIGCGGTGSQVLSGLARIDAALRGLDKPGLHVTAYDPDTVTPANLGRQLFCESELDMNKAVALVSRFNRFYGTGWDAVRGRYNDDPANIIITCTDNIASRQQVRKIMDKEQGDADPHKRIMYWTDFGNTQSTGQVVLGSKEIDQPKTKKFKTVGKLPFITELVDYSSVSESASGPSCSLAEALEKQDLFINSTLAQLGCDILWKLLRNGIIEHHGLYLNLDTLKMNPIAV